MTTQTAAAFDGRYLHVVETQPNRERLAFESLAAQGFEAILPTIIRSYVAYGAVHMRRMPLFTGYLFVFFDASVDRWQAINGSRGARRVMCDGELRPVALPAAVAQEVVERFGGGPITEEVVGFDVFAPGAKLRVRYGDWIGQIGECLWASSQRRLVRVELEVFKRKVPVTMDLAAVEAA